MESRKDSIRGFLSRFFSTEGLASDADIFALGFVNSLLALQLVDFLEKEFEITVEDEDLDLDNFRTIDGMDALVARKTASDGEHGVASSG